MKERYTIGEVAKHCNISTKTLRYYDKIGLLKPEFKDPGTKYRYYSKRQLTTLAIIRRYRSMDFCLKDIQVMISDIPLNDIEDKVLKRQKELSAEMASLQRKEQTCQTLLEHVRAGNTIRKTFDDGPSTVIVEDIPEGVMFFTRKIMKEYQNSDVNLDRWIEIIDSCQRLNYSIISPVIITYHSEILGQFLMKDCDVEFGVLVDAELLTKEQREDTRVRDWGGKKAAVSYHFGSFESIVNTHLATTQWVYKNGYEVIGPISDEFVVSPLDIDNEDLHVTKVIIPIQKRGGK